MTIDVIRKPSPQLAEKKIRRGRCITPRCTRVAGRDRHVCNTCRDRAWRAAHPERHLYKNLKSSAKKRSVEFSITFDEFKAFCDREHLVARIGIGPDDATVDRRDPSLGYSARNLRVLTNAENGRLGGALAYSGHRLEGQQQFSDVAASMSYTPEEDPLQC